MLRELESSILLDQSADVPASFAFLVSVAEQYAGISRERFEITVDGTAIDPIDGTDQLGTRLHRIDTAASRIEVSYSATIDGLADPVAPTEMERILYRRPSRYAESDLLLPSSQALFAGLSGWALVDAVVDWVAGHIAYISGTSEVTDSARDTYLSRTGVCRDFAHLVIALLRGHDLPARLVAVYAPGLRPMDFHAVVEVLVDDAWYVVDATHLAPRSRMVRISTGRDAADTAFLTNTLTNAQLVNLSVQATTDTPVDEDPYDRVQLR